MIHTDEQIALAVQRGQREALSQLVDRHYDPLMGYLYRLLDGDRALAEDTAQETFLRALRSIQQYEYPRSFKAWLYAIATNIARNHYTKAETRRVHLFGEDEDPPDEHAPPELAAIARDESEAVRNAIRALSAEARETLLLFYAQQLSYQEIAETLSIPIGTVKSRLANAVRRMREMMKVTE